MKFYRKLTRNMTFGEAAKILEEYRLVSAIFIGFHTLWLILLTAFLLTSCGVPRNRFKLPSNGEVVDCVYNYTDCGLELYQCTNGRHYYCLTNVERVD